MKKNLWILPLLMIVSSCIRNDNDDCSSQPSMLLYFSYLGDGTQDIFPSKIENVNLYIFGQDDQLVEQHLIDRAELQAYQGTRLTLPEGLYHVVCWGNTFTNTTVINQQSRLIAELSHPNYYAHQTIMTNDSLYYVYQKVYIPASDPVVPDTLYFNGAHIKFRVYLHGAYKDADNNPFYIHVNNLSPTYNFEMLNKNPLVSYQPNGFENVAAPMYCYYFNTLRISDNNPVTIDLMNAKTQESFYTLPLKDYMTQYGIHVDGRNEAIINVHFHISSLGVSVLPWEDEDLKPEI